MSSPSHHLHDRFFKSAFAHQELMKEYIQNFLPHALSEKIHLDSLEQQKESYLDKNLHQYFSDVVYTVKYGKSEATISLLLEHKSYVPPYPWLQLLQYMLNVWKAQAARPGFNGLFHPVIPIVIYHGEQTWRVRQVSSYFEAPDDIFQPFIPEFDYLLNDLSRYSEKELLDMDGSWARLAFLALQASRNNRGLASIDIIFQGLNLETQEEKFLTYLYQIIVYLLKVQHPEKDIMRAIDQLQSPVKDKVLSVYDQILRQGKLEGREEGREEGKEEAAFIVFKNGRSMGLPIDQLVKLTGIAENTASFWDHILEQNPGASYKDIVPNQDSPHLPE